jgi:hypothetical protein
MTEKARDKIIQLRKSGATCREAAEAIGVSQSAVWYTMRAHGLAGKIRAHRSGYTPPGSIHRAVDEYGTVTIEEGASGGYIVTVADVYQGNECGSIGAAIRSASEKAGRL